MTKSWLAWSAATVFLLLYVSAGYVASQPDVVSIRLEQGYATQLRIFRLAEDQLRMQLWFKVGDRPRPELGEYRTWDDWTKTGVIRFANPGSAVRIAASMPNTTSVTFEAMPNSIGPQSELAMRNLIPGTSVSRGEWQWPPTTRGLALHRGTNVVNIEVVIAERPLGGEVAELRVMAPLGVKSHAPNHGWLWFWFFWPFLLVGQALWAVALVWRRWRQPSQ